MSKHTPGPWSLAAAAGERQYRIEGYGNPSGTVAIVLARVGSATGLADARLIAAAPELLAALENIAAGLADTKSTPNRRMTRITKQQAHEIARAALAKVSP